MDALVLGSMRGLWLVCGHTDVQATYPHWAATLTGFTWCTAEGCEDGTIYDGSDVDLYHDDAHDFGHKCRDCGGAGVL